MCDTYSITLTPAELGYLRNALDSRIEEAPSSERLLLLIHSMDENGARVTINKTAYDLVYNLRFGGSSFEKDWTRNEAIA
jgi:hypothetical protein